MLKFSVNQESILLEIKGTFATLVVLDSTNALEMLIAHKTLAQDLLTLHALLELHAFVEMILKNAPQLFLNLHA